MHWVSVLQLKSYFSVVLLALVDANYRNLGVVVMLVSLLLGIQLGLRTSAIITSSCVAGLKLLASNSTRNGNQYNCYFEQNFSKFL